jgi:putative MFS transporter
MCLIGAGMFFDGYDMYVGTSALGAAVQSKFATLNQVPQFISLGFLGMTIGAFVTGFLGDKFGRRFNYQFNLMIFGLASLVAAVAPDMTALNWIRFVMGIGLGAETVVGFSTLAEFVPPRVRGRWCATMVLIVALGLPATAVLSNFIIPAFGWRPMFVIAGIGALIVWYLRKSLPESPRWLESQGRTAEAEALMQEIEREAATAGPLPPPSPPAPAVSFRLASLVSPALLPRMVVGCVCLICINTVIFGFVQWLPTFFVQQGLSITKSLNYTLVIVLGSPIGGIIGVFCADYLGRRPSIIGASICTIILGAIYANVADPTTILVVGFLLIVSIYVQAVVLFGVYTPELFPTEVRLRAVGICNTFGRLCNIVAPFIVLSLFTHYGISGVLSLMIGLVVVQIAVVWVWGIEPVNRPLEAIEPAPRGVKGIHEVGTTQSSVAQ